MFNRSFYGDKIASIAAEHDQDEISKENSRKLKLQSGTVIRILVEDNSLI